MHYVYILKCQDTKSYVGCTNDLKDRIKRHNHGEIKATQDRLPVELMMYTAFSDKYKAYAFERYLKTGSGRSFMKRHFFNLGD